MDKEKQQKLKDLSFGQHKILTASGVILVLSEKNFFDEKRFYYFFGNHNQILKNENKAKDILANYYDEYLEVGATLFPNIKIKESMILRDSYTGKEMLAIHGHQGDLMNDRLWRVSMFFVRFFYK